MRPRSSTQQQWWMPEMLAMIALKRQIKNKNRCGSKFLGQTIVIKVSTKQVSAYQKPLTRAYNEQRGSPPTNVYYCKAVHQFVWSFQLEPQSEFPLLGAAQSPWCAVCRPEQCYRPWRQSTPIGFMQLAGQTADSGGTHRCHDAKCMKCNMCCWWEMKINQFSRMTQQQQQIQGGRSFKVISTIDGTGTVVNVFRHLMLPRNNLPFLGHWTMPHRRLIFSYLVATHPGCQMTQDQIRWLGTRYTCTFAH